ncbi:hypothetical protein KCV01_g14589, partial [Aureobasidium melanogenum]
MHEGGEDGHDKDIQHRPVPHQLHEPVELGPLSRAPLARPLHGYQQVAEDDEFEHGHHDARREDDDGQVARIVAGEHRDQHGEETERPDARARDHVEIGVRLHHGHEHAQHEHLDHAPGLDPDQGGHRLAKTGRPAPLPGEPQHPAEQQDLREREEEQGERRQYGHHLGVVLPHGDHGAPEGGVGQHAGKAQGDDGRDVGDDEDDERGEDQGELSIDAKPLMALKHRAANRASGHLAAGERPPPWREAAQARWRMIANPRKRRMTEPPSRSLKGRRGLDMLAGFPDLSAHSHRIQEFPVSSAQSTSEHIFDATTAGFENDVVKASLQTPVLVDLWAEWCGPCKSLGPILEKLAVEFNGAFRLAKIDVDAEQELAAMFGVRSIPTVILIKGGQMADGFA